MTRHCSQQNALLNKVIVETSFSASHAPNARSFLSDEVPGKVCLQGDVSFATTQADKLLYKMSFPESMLAR